MYKFPFADFNKINDAMNSKKIQSSQKLAYIHEAIGGHFHDDDKRIMTGPASAIVNIGGLATEINQGALYILGNKVTLQDIKDSIHQSIGMSSFMSYLNPKNKSLEDIAKTTLDLNHLSVLHQASVSVLITGITIGVEHEFSTQRDIVHLSRITVSKTKAQETPCLVLSDKNCLSVYQEVLASTENILRKSNIQNRETRNLLFPTAKASGLIITGSLRNMKKLIALKNYDGKEFEFITALMQIENNLSQLI